MRARQSGRSKKDPLRPILGTAISVLGLGVVLMVISVLTGSNPSASIQAFSKGLRVPVPYVLLLGLGLLVLYAVLRRKADAPSRERNDPAFVGSHMTDFVSHLHRTPPEMGPVDATSRAQVPPVTTWSARVFEDIGWRRFEALCASLFAQADCEVREESYGAEGGLDIWLHSRGADGPTAVVHCRHRLGKPVGVDEVREFHEVMASRKLHDRTFATSSTFAVDARQFAKDNSISLLDGQELLALISRRTPAEQMSLLAIAYGAIA